MTAIAFRQRFITFCQINAQRRRLELQGELASDPGVFCQWQEARHRITSFYQQDERYRVVKRALADPYFPLTMLRKLNVEEFAAESELAALPVQRMEMIEAETLHVWAAMFLSIRQDLARLNTHGQVSNMKLMGSAEESLAEGGWCTNCGGCCQIRGGPAEFSNGFEPPERWVLYFRGDACRYQRFCPFLFEYFATARFFCAIYLVKPKCCWIFGREECQFLHEDLARERATQV